MLFYEDYVWSGFVLLQPLRCAGVVFWDTQSAAHQPLLTDCSCCSGCCCGCCGRHHYHHRHNHYYYQAYNVNYEIKHKTVIIFMFMSHQRIIINSLC